MKKTHHLYLFILCCLSIAPLRGQAGLTVSSTQAMEFGQKVAMHSTILGEDRVMNILLPESFYEVSEDHVYPVLFIDGEHGNEFFHAVGGLVKHLSSVTRMPETIIISFHEGITYGPDVYTNGMWTSRDRLKLDADPNLFARHLEEELFPYLKKNFRAADYRMIMGVSGSSLFSLHSFAKLPGLFDAHLLFAAADMIGMGYEPGQTFIDVFEERFQKSPESRGQLYLSVAEDDVNRGSRDIVLKNLMDELEGKLSPYRAANLKLKVEIIPGEGHYDSILKGLLSALEMIFPKGNWSPKFRDLIAKPGDAMDNIDAWHQKRSDEYGFAILPKAERWNNVNCLRFIGGMLLRDGKVKEAVKVFERRLQYRPRSVVAMKSLAEALEADGQTARAKELNAQINLLDQSGEEGTKEEDKEIPKEVLKQQFETYLLAQKSVFRKGSTVADANALFDLYTGDFKYNHPKYGGYYTRELLYNNTVKYIESGGYDNAKERKVLNVIYGLNTVVMEQQYEGSEETTMTLIKFKGDKIFYMEEYW